MAVAADFSPSLVVADGPAAGGASEDDELQGPPQGPQEWGEEDHAESFAVEGDGEGGEGDVGQDGDPEDGHDLAVGVDGEQVEEEEVG